MKITRSSTATYKGSADWFSGDVHVDALADPADGAGVSGVLVHFAPGARTAWHTHPRGQTIFVTVGGGRCGRRGEPPEDIRPGDRVFFAPGEDHWHGASPDRFMTHIAIAVVDDSGAAVTWGDHVTDDDYGTSTSSS